MSLGLLTLEAQNLILAGALFSITLNSFVFSAVEPVQRWIRERSHLARLLERSGDPLAMLPDEVDQAYLRDQVVIVGYGGVGRRITENLINQNIKVVIAEENREIVEKLRHANIAAVSGVATEPGVLIQAHIMHARLLVISPMDILDIHRIVDIAKQLNPQIQVLICAESKKKLPSFEMKILVKYSMQKKKWQRYESSYFKSNRTGASVNTSLTYTKKRTLEYAFFN